MCTTCWISWRAATRCPPGLNGASCRAPAGGRPSQPQRFYVEQLATMRERELKCLYVNFEHVAEFDQVGGGRAGAGGGRADVAAAAGTACLRLRCCGLECIAGDSSWQNKPCLPCCNAAGRAGHLACGTPSKLVPFYLGASQLLPLMPPVPLPVLQSLAQNIAEAYYRLEQFLRAAVRTFVRQHLDTFAENEDGTDKQVGVAQDGRGRGEGARGVCGAWLRCSASAVRRGTGAARGQHCTCAAVPCCRPRPPASLHLHGLMQFWISFYGLPDNDKLRALRSNKIGKLSQVRQASSDWSDSLGHAWKRRPLLRALGWWACRCCAGTQYACQSRWASVAEPSTCGLRSPPSHQFVGTVTRTTDVRPELFTGTFRCMECMTGACGHQWSSSSMRWHCDSSGRPLAAAMVLGVSSSLSPVPAPRSAAFCWLQW